MTIRARLIASTMSVLSALSSLPLSVATAQAEVQLARAGRTASFASAPPSAAIQGVAAPWGIEVSPSAAFVLGGQFVTASEAQGMISDPAQFRGMVNSLAGNTDSDALDDKLIEDVLKNDEKETEAEETKSKEKGKPAPGKGISSTPYKGPFRSPIKAGVITGRFGDWRGDHRHSGLDLAAPSGTPIYAAAPGKVIFAGVLGGYGNLLIVKHDKTKTSYYAHQSVFKVKKGTPVAMGQRIGSVGSTGHSTGPHVHFEVRVSGTPTNPCKKLGRC